MSGRLGAYGDEGSYIDFLDVAPSDTVDFKPTRGLWVGGIGDVSVKKTDGTTAVFTAVPAGTELKIKCVRVNLTGTSATLMLRLY